MKKSLITLTLMVALVGCDDASKAIDQAQSAANKAVDTLQQKADAFSVENLDLAMLGSATQKAKEFAQSIESVINTDLTSQEAIAAATDKISNSYQCLIESSSETTAKTVLDQVVSSIKNDQLLAIINQGVEQAKTAKACVM